ncbi:MAG: potassium-transporting ATPase subunit KdpC [Bauldia sp.]
MSEHIRPAFVLLLLFTLLTGIAYPLAITGVASVIFPGQASGSLIEKNGVVIGSSLVGQPFAADRYFHPRPSAAGAGYDGGASSGSNLGPTSKKLVDRVTTDIAALRSTGVTGPIPADAVTTSASGLDPDISPAYALLQVKRVAAARNLPDANVRALVDRNTTGPTLGILGEPRVNVLLLNLALDGVPSR